MSLNIDDIAIICPVKFQYKNYVNPAPYNIKYDEDWAYPATIPDFYEKPAYLQPFQNNDIIFLQLLSNFGIHNMELLGCQGNQVATFVFAYVPTSIEGTGQKVFEASIALNAYPEGVYYLRISSGSPVLFISESELFEIKALHENSFLFQYKHDENDFDVVFETGIEFRLRTFGGFPLEQYKPGSDRTVFIDQSKNAVTLNSRTFDVDKLLIGDAGGIPRYLIKKINTLFGCSNVLIDGKQYVANGTELEAVTQELYPMAGWGISLQPADSKTRRRFQADGNSNNPTTVVYNIEGDEFGAITAPGSSNIIQIAPFI